MSNVQMRDGAVLVFDGELVLDDDCCCYCNCAQTPPNTLYATLAGTVRVDAFGCDGCPLTLDDTYTLDFEELLCRWIYYGSVCTIPMGAWFIAATIAREAGTSYLLPNFGIGGAGWMDSRQLPADPPDCDAIDETFSLASMGVVGCYDFSAATIRFHSAA